MAQPSIQYTFYPERVTEKVNAKMPNIAARIGTLYANEVKEIMRDSPATGVTYQRGSVTHKASAPGEAPAPDTGTLMRSVIWEIRKEGSTWIIEVGSNLKYAVYLEFGAASGIRDDTGKLSAIQWILYPRPSWGPALDRIRPEIPKLFERNG